MLHYSTILDRYDQVRFLQYRDFLASRSADEEAYCVAPKGMNVAEAERAIVNVTFSADAYDDGNRQATTRLETTGGSVAIISGLPTALGILLFIFDEPQNIEYLRSLDMTKDAETAVREMGIDRAVLQRRIANDKPGNYIAPVDAGWRLYNVDTYGEMSIIADCELPVPLAYVEFTIQQDRATNLSARVGAFVPANAMEILRG